MKVDEAIMEFQPMQDWITNTPYDFTFVFYCSGSVTIISVQFIVEEKFVIVITFTFQRLLKLLHRLFVIRIWIRQILIYYSFVVLLPCMEVLSHDVQRRNCHQQARVQSLISELTVVAGPSSMQNCWWPHQLCAISWTCTKIRLDPTCALVSTRSYRSSNNPPVSSKLNNFI